MTVYKQPLELHDMAIKDVQRYPQKRELFHRLTGDTGKHFIGIIGPRGVGKNIILKQLAASNRDAFYLSLDNLEENDLFEIAKTLSETYGYRFLLFDEIHYHRHYQNQLKKIFDFLNIRVIFSSSMSLSLWESVYDLSRRIKLVHLYPFSFREYLFLKRVFRCRI